MANTLYRKFKKRSLFRPLQGGWQVNPSRGRYGGGLVGSFQQAMDKANAANERRYQQILSGFDDLAKRTQGNLAGLGQAQLTDINREYGNAGSNVYNTLVNRGFGNSSLPATMQQGVMRGRSQEVGRLNEQLARMRADYDMAITQGKLGAIERRSDIAPDYGQLVQLAQAMGRGGYGSPGYGGGYGVGYGGGGSPGGYGGGGGGMFMSPIGPGGDYWQNTWNNAYQNAMYWATFQRPGMFPYTPRANVRSQMSRLARYGGRMPAPVAGPAMAGQAPRIPGAAMKYGKTLARYLPGAMGILPGLPPYGPQASPQTGSPNMGMQNQIFNMLSSRLPAASSPAYSPLSELQRRRSNWSQAAVPNMDMQNQVLNMLSQRLPQDQPPWISPLPGAGGPNIITSLPQRVSWTGGAYTRPPNWLQTLREAISKKRGMPRYVYAREMADRKRRKLPPIDYRRWLLEFSQANQPGWR